MVFAQRFCAMDHTAVRTSVAKFMDDDGLEALTELVDVFSNQIIQLQWPDRAAGGRAGTGAQWDGCLCRKGTSRRLNGRASDSRRGLS